MRKTALIITSAVAVASLAGGAAAYAVGTTASAPSIAASTTATAAPGTPAGGSEPGSPEMASGDLAGLDTAIAAAMDEVGAGTVIDAEIDDDRSHAYEIDIRLDSGGEVEVHVAADFTVVSVRDDTEGDAADAATDDSADDEAVTDAGARQKAADAALAHVGRGTVESVELSDDADHVYEVEIDLGNGEDADVELDAAFGVVKVD